MFSKVFHQAKPFAKDPLRLAIANEIRSIQLKPYKRLHFKFDPFHPNVASIREFLINSTTPKVRRTNNKCTFKTDILSDQAEPQIICHLENGKKIVFKTANLTTFELMKYFNQYSNKFTEKTE